MRSMFMCMPKYFFDTRCLLNLSLFATSIASRRSSLTTLLHLFHLSLITPILRERERGWREVCASSSRRRKLICTISAQMTDFFY